MTVRTLEGFGHYTAGQLTQKGWGVGGSILIDVAYGRDGRSGLYWTLSGSSRNFTKVFDKQAHWIVGFALIPQASTFAESNICELLYGTGHTAVRLTRDTSDYLNVYRASSWLGGSTTVLQIGTPIYVEWDVTVNEVTGAFNLYINGVSEASGTDINTDDWGDGGTDRVKFSENRCSFGDIYILDGNSPDNTALGDTKILTYYPVSDGTYSQWTPSTGTDHFAVVDETLVDTADYLSTSGSGNSDIHNFQTMTGISTINAIQHCLWSTTGSGTSTIQSTVRTSGTNYYGGNLALDSADGDVDKLTLWTTNPNTGLAWQQSGFNATQFGVYSVTS